MSSSKNFTQEQGLVRQLTDKGWFANPAGIEGHVVLVLERRGKEGTVLHCSLKPGETLRLDERLFGRYEAYAVDIRKGLSFPISSEFPTAEPIRTVSLRCNVRYRVVEARKVALYAADPLGALRDRVIANLNQQLARYPMEQVTGDLCVKIVTGVGYQDDLGLAVEGADVLELSLDRKVVSHLGEQEDLRHQIEIEEIRRAADLDARMREEQVQMRIQQMWVDGIDLRNPNALMRQHPELISQVIERLDQRDRLIFEQQFAYEDDRREMLKRIINAYVEQELSEGGVLDLDALARFVEERLVPPGLKAEKREKTGVGFGESLDALPGRIEFGGEKGGTLDKEERIEFGEPEELGER